MGPRHLLRRGSRGDEVKKVQAALNRQVPQVRLPGGRKLAEDGIFGPKTEQAVRTFQRLHPPLKVDGIVGKNTWAALGLNTGASAGGAPSFCEKEPLDGFDDSVRPPWQMVPLNGQKIVLLKNADGLTVSSKNPAIATVEEHGGRRTPGVRELLIKGKSKGTTFIEAKRSGRVVARLEVAVKNKKTVRVFFNFVEDNAGHKTRRNPSQVDAWVRTMNRIFSRQANIEVRKLGTATVRINQNLGSVVRFSSHLSGVASSEHEWGIITARGNASADFNVFFVWEYEQDATPGTDHADAGTMGKNCIFEDRAGREVGETLAHELGHTLGCDDTYSASNKKLLMYGITDDRGRKIGKADANIMNP